MSVPTNKNKKCLVCGGDGNAANPNGVSCKECRGEVPYYQYIVGTVNPTVVTNPTKPQSPDNFKP